MNRSIRKLVGGGAAALALGGFFALIVAPQLAGASNASHRTPAGVANVAPKVGTLSAEGSLLKVAIHKKVPAPAHAAAVTPSAACTTAKNNLAAALAQEKAEDATEKANAASDPNFKTSDVAEDAAEAAARKPLVDAVRANCGFAKWTPSPGCTAALQSLKAAFQAEMAEDTAERSAGTEGTPADVAEDKAEMAKMAPMWQAIKASCALGTHGAFSKFGSVKSFSFQH